MMSIGNLRRLLGHPWRRSFRSRGPSRYDVLDRVFEEEAVNKRQIMEIGTYMGSTAARLLRIALRYEPGEAVHYYGFDLFEDLDEKTLRREASKRPKRTMEEIRSLLVAETALPPKNIHLYRGFTRDTLWATLPGLPLMGFIFIDGGHSTETARNDWEACQRLMDRRTVVVLDDYYHFSYGPRVVVDGLDRAMYEVQTLEPEEVFPDRFGISPDGMLRIRMVKMRLR